MAIRASGQEIRLITPAAVSNKPGNTFVVSATADNREVLEGFMRAWSKGMYVAQIDPEVVAKIAQITVPVEWEDPTFGEQYLAHAMRLNGSVTDQNGDLQTEIWSRIQPAMIKLGVICEAVEPSVFLDPSFIAPANDWSAEEVQKEVADLRAANM